MSLSLALNTARSSLAASATQIAVSGQNIAGASDPTYSRKVATTILAPDGSGEVTIRRLEDAGLYRKMIVTASLAASKRALSDGLDRLNATVGDPADAASPAAKLSALRNAFLNYANAPEDQLVAARALSAAKDATATLREASATVAKVRADADAAMADGIVHVNDLLARFETLNTAVVKGTGAGTDVSTEMDQRDAILAQLSQEMGVTTISRSNNDIAIMTDGGVPLFDRTARTISFTPTPIYGPGTVGSAITIDGVVVTGPNAAMPLRSGAIAGLADLRDNAAVTYQAQLDEIARGLIAAFAETDQSAGGNPNATGLFGYSGSPAVPPDGVRMVGLAAGITINAAADPEQGGNLSLMRDGGFGGLNYVYNSSGSVGFSDRIRALADAMASARSFDPSAQLDASAALTDYASHSAGWLQGARQAATQAADYQATLATRASDSLANAVGVSLDDEYAKQLQLEQSYQASSKLVAVIGQLFQTLMNSF